MNIIKAHDYDDLSKKAGAIIAAQILKKPDSILGLATGSTPVGTYSELINLHSKGIVDFKNTVTYNLDEYVGITKDNPQSFHNFMMERLFNHINIDKNNVHILDGMAKDLDKEAKAYDEKIKASGGIDLQILGIGHNGHIGFNEPDEAFSLSTRIVELSESTINANSRFFENEDEVPHRALSMGIGTIMNAKSIVILIAGEEKAEIMDKMINNPVTPLVPASILQLHKDVTVIYSL